MSRLHRTTRASRGALALVTILAACSPPTQESVTREDHAPVIPGLVGTDLPAALRGRVLLGELGCTSCHDAGATPIERRRAPDLGKVATRVQASYLKTFLMSPHAAEPGTAMPDVLRHLEGADLERTADELSHFLRSNGGEALAATAIDDDAAARGATLYDTIGCKSCHFATTDSRHRQNDKYTVASLQQFLLDPHAARPAARMPAMALSPAEAFDLANHLLAGGDANTNGNANSAETAAVDPAKASAGRAHFASYGCVNCHGLADETTAATTSMQKALRDTDPTKGCLSGTIGAWPHFALSAQQTEDLRAALASFDETLADEARVQQLMASRNCFACHDRGSVNTLTERQEDFTTNDASIGQDGRMPPTLTGVGSKLQDEWLRDAIAHGQRERPYIVTRMPGFGDAFADTLHGALVAVDDVPEFAVTPLPKPRKEAEVITKLGAQLIGDKGMNCITCHYFAGEKAGAVGAVDLVHSTGKRLRPEWFAGFLRHPFRFKPVTLMPQFFPDGKSTRPEIADGDTQKQVDAMWHYLAKGRNVRKPSGMRHPPIELKVEDEAVMLRRSVQNTGKRGISIGYPGGVSTTFDAESLAMNQIWWGRFVDARPVWTGQGSGQAHILNRDRGMLAKGPAFANVATDEPWPTATRRDRGDRFFGYDLDDQQRPTFRYSSGEVTVDDYSREVVDRDTTRLQRTLSVKGDGKQTTFLAARGKGIEKLDDHTARIGRWLHVHVADHEFAIVTAGEEKELRIMIPMENGTRQVQLTYSWHKEGK